MRCARSTEGSSSPVCAAPRPNSYNLGRIVRENFDKLFTAHLRLPPLSGQEITTLVRAFGATEPRADGGTSPSTTGTGRANNILSAVLADEVTRDGGRGELSSAGRPRHRQTRQSSHRRQGFEANEANSADKSDTAGS